MRAGTQTSHPGIRRDGKDGFIVRVAIRDPNNSKRFREKQRHVVGTLSDAIKAREALRDELKAEPQQPTATTPKSDETVAEYAKRWLQHLKETGRNRVHSLEKNILTMERFILPILGEMQVHAVTRADVARWMANLGTLTQRNGNPYAKETLATGWRCLRTMFRDALVLCDLDKDPTDGVRFAVKGNERKEKDVLTAEELALLLKETEHEAEDIRCMIWLGFTTGMRFGELSALTWSDVDFGRRCIHVRKSQVNGVVGPTKTRGYRTVPLHPFVAEILRRQEAWSTRQSIKPVTPGMVFPSNVGTYRHASMLGTPLQRCANRAELGKHVSAHTMRRTFNNLARMAAGEIVTRAMTGHATSAMTEHYSHVSIAEKAKALDAALSGTLGGVLGLGVGVGPNGGPTPTDKPN